MPRSRPARSPRPPCRRLGALCLLLAGWLACASAEPAPPSATEVAPTRPLLWAADPPGAGGRLYLLGSIHMGTPELGDLGPAVAAAWEEADELVVEVDVSRIDAAETARILLEYGMLRDGRTLRDVLPPETFAALERYLTGEGVPPHAYLGFKPWLASTLVAVTQLQASGLDARLGVDQQLIERAAGADKPIVELESFASQMRMLDGLGPDVQQLMLEEALLRSEEVGDETLALVDAWRRGDEEALGHFFFGSVEENPHFASLYEKVFYERNEAMCERLRELALDGRTRLAVVGAGHMVGPRGIPALLAARGFRVRRVPEP